MGEISTVDFFSVCLDNSFSKGACFLQHCYCNDEKEIKQLLAFYGYSCTKYALFIHNASIK